MPLTRHLGSPAARLCSHVLLIHNAWKRFISFAWFVKLGEFLVSFLERDPDEDHDENALDPRFSFHRVHAFDRYRLDRFC